jgi:hypothetical protein
MAKSMFLLLDANYHGKLLQGKIEDGMVMLENKQFMVDQSNPIWFEKGLSVRPLYIIKWSAVQPSTNLNPIGDSRSKFGEIMGKNPPPDRGDGIIQNITPGPVKAEKMKPQFRDKYEITPDLFRKISGMRILGNMIPIKKQRNFGPMLLMIALVAMVAVAAFAMTLIFHIKLW